MSFFCKGVVRVLKRLHLFSHLLVVGTIPSGTQKKNTLPVSHYTPAKGSNFFYFFFFKFESANFEYFLLVGVKLSKKTLVKSEHVLQET